AWGGNWFFLVAEHGQELSLGRVDELRRFTWAIRQTLSRAGVTGAGAAEIDHIELFGPATRPDANARNFVLCPGGAYDRSPCGTGTSAKLACMIADGKLRPGQVWRQESIVGTLFEATGELGPEGKVIPRITGTAYVTAEATLLFQRDDPFREGMRS
ncbi:MAG TPA: hydroxyproline-2-epimerase, partial [Planctomycetaceae bacterium]|nr:hydroxyproline-2-epimerase [Planctomycetaceae bacterium]